MINIDFKQEIQMNSIFIMKIIIVINYSLIIIYIWYII
jgi:hypothetical protein